MCETGARINEIANICVGDIKFKEKAILLSWSKTTPRPVFFTPETAIYLKKHLDAFFPDPEKDSFKKIFPGKNMIYKIIDSMLKDLGLKTKGDGREPHTFRHYGERYKMVSDDSKPAKPASCSSIHSPFYH